jgi:rubrerythrin
VIGIGETNRAEDEYTCPSCGSIVEREAKQCPICSEDFTNGATEAPATIGDENATPTDALEGTEVPYVCESCGKDLPHGTAECPDCKDGSEPAPDKDEHVCCPVCGSLRYTVETGDLVKCDECGNAYVLPKPEPEGFFKSWKWKFWIGLTFILVGDFGFALASYIHNVLRWTFLGDMYLGYGWIDSLLGALGIVLFAVGIVLFAWSFKREREVKCGSCGVYILEKELIPTDEPRTAPSEDSVKDVLTEIEGDITCPSCGKAVALFDENCPSCGHILVELKMSESFETVRDSSTTQEVPVANDEISNGDGRELYESIESLENVGTNGNNGTNDASIENYIMEDLEKLEAKQEVPGKECPSCGIVADPNSTECPVCGTSFKGAK